jgi:sugar lactone lactonase YvrE
MGQTERDRKVTCLVEDLQFPESPRWHGGALYFSDFYTHKVSRVVPGGRSEVAFEVDAQPSGLGFVGDRLVVASMLDQRVLKDDGSGLTTFAELEEHTDGPLNDLLVDPDQGIYVGNFGFGPEATEITPTSLLRLDADGTPTVVAEDVIFPNGMAITPDGATLYLAETFAYRISAFDRAPDGTLSNRRTWAEFESAPSPTVAHVLEVDAVSPDGIWLDAEGALWVADAGGSGALKMVDGEVVDRIPVAAGTAVYALTLGGDNGNTLFMCTAAAMGKDDHQKARTGRVLMCDVDVPGASFGPRA